MNEMAELSQDCCAQDPAVGMLLAFLVITVSLEKVS